MSDWPDSATRHAKGAVLAEARRRGLIAPDGGAVWLYMFHDIHGVAHFRHVDHRAWMQMMPDDAEMDPPAHGAGAVAPPDDDISADRVSADTTPDDAVSADADAVDAGTTTSGRANDNDPADGNPASGCGPGKPPKNSGRRSGRKGSRVRRKSGDDAGAASLNDNDRDGDRNGGDRDGGTKP